MVEFRSVFEGSFRVATSEGDPVAGVFSVQENIVHFTPSDPLGEQTTYTVTVPAGGITDFSGNATDDEVLFRFSTGGSL